MGNEKTTLAYKRYYDAVLKHKHPNPDLIAAWGADPGRFETQILCHASGTKIPDTNKYEQDGEVFGPHRWPYNAKTEPNYSDPPIQYVISKRLKAIGWTGWDWRNKHSVALGFDLDSISGHATGLTDEEIAAFDQLDIPWLEIIRSTRGRGRHLYIKFKEPYPVTQNHDEHAALARAYIPLIAKHSGMDFDAQKDVCGMVMWIYHTEASGDGYTCVKPATQILTAEYVPPNWRDHLDVVSGSRSKVRVTGWAPSGPTKGDELDEMTQASAKVELDETHLAILDALEGTGHTSLWVHDHHLWQGHTGGLKHVFDEFAAKGTPLRGLFDTNSSETDPGKPNCFARPRPDGAWDVYRFGESIEEHLLWDLQGKWTHITYNFPATLKQICLACGGYEGTDEKQGYMFDSVDELKEALQLLESKLKLPEKADGRPLALHADKNGRTVLVIGKERKDKKEDFPRYVKTPRGWEIWIRDAVETPDTDIEEERQWSELDHKVRALVADAVTGKAFDSWVLKDDNGGWVTHPRENIRSYLMSIGFGKPDPIFGGAVYKAWELVNKPFQAEYPGGRTWNRAASQFVYAPAELGEDEEPNHPTWNRIVEHCGNELNEYIPILPWCKDWGIATGGDYLTAWIACMFQNPFGKLPYLFMYGPQESGKSTFHEAIELLVTKGVQKADRALTSSQGYNGELVGAILGVIDEVDVNKAGATAYNRLKEWVTGLTISIHAKYQSVRDITSTLHFVQMANSRSSLPVFPGDTRITAMNVPALEEEIPKERLFELLRKEAPHYMHTLMNWPIPEATGRLMLPIIETQGKIDAAAANVSELDQFVNDNCFCIPGAAIKLSEFRLKFLESLEDYQRNDWSPQRIKTELSEKFPVGRGAINQTIVGNLTFEKDTPPSVPYVSKNGKVMKEIK